MLEDGSIVAVGEWGGVTEDTHTDSLAIQDGVFGRAYALQTLSEMLRHDVVRHQGSENPFTARQVVSTRAYLAVWPLPEGVSFRVYFAVWPGLNPTVQGANSAAESGLLEVVQFLADQELILPNQEGVNAAAARGHLNVLQFLASRTMLPDVEGANASAERGHLHVLRFMAACQILPDVRGANEAAAGGHVNVVKFLAGLDILPDADGAYWAAENGHLDVVEFLANWGVIPEPARIGARQLDLRAVLALARRSARDEEDADPAVIVDVFRRSRRRRHKNELQY